MQNMGYQQKHILSKTESKFTAVKIPYRLMDLGIIKCQTIIDNDHFPGGGRLLRSLVNLISYFYGT